MLRRVNWKRTRSFLSESKYDFFIHSVFITGTGGLKYTGRLIFLMPFATFLATEDPHRTQHISVFSLLCVFKVLYGVLPRNCDRIKFSRNVQFSKYGGILRALIKIAP